MQLGNELEMLTRMVDENVLPGKENLLDYTQMGTTDSTVLEEWRYLAGTMRDTTHVTFHHPGSFHIHSPQYLARRARGFKGPPY